MRATPCRADRRQRMAHPAPDILCKHGAYVAACKARWLMHKQCRRPSRAPHLLLRCESAAHEAAHVGALSHAAVCDALQEQLLEVQGAARGQLTASTATAAACIPHGGRCEGLSHCSLKKPTGWSRQTHQGKRT